MSITIITIIIWRLTLIDKLSTDDNCAFKSLEACLIALVVVMVSDTTLLVKSNFSTLNICVSSISICCSYLL